MKRKNLIILLSIGLLSLLTFIVFRFEDIEKILIQLFKMDKLVVHKNANGKLEGESILYLNGKISVKGNFINGLKNGTVTRYYDNGQVKDKIYYIRDKASGKEQNYFPSGKLKYECFWKDGKRYGDLYYYFDNGQLDAFHTYDILQQKINIIRYNEFGKMIKIEGSVFGKSLYSIDKKDAIIILSDNGKYHDIDDLYI